MVVGVVAEEVTAVVVGVVAEELTVVVAVDVG